MFQHSSLNQCSNLEDVGIRRLDRNAERKLMGLEYKGEIKTALNKSEKDPSHYLE